MDAILVPVTLKGRTLHFILDTGASSSVYDSSVVGLLGKALGERTVKVADNLATFKAYESPDARLGQLTFRPRLGVLAADLRFLREGFGEEVLGIVGMDFLRDHVFRVDLDHGEVVFLKSPEADAGQQILIHFDNSQVPYVDAMPTGYGGREPFMVDTGLCGRVSGDLRAELYTTLGKKGSLRRSATSVAGTPAGTIAYERGRLEEIALADQRHKNLLFAITTDDSKLGFNYWARYNVTFDFPHSALYLKPGKQVDKPDLEDMSGLIVLKQNGRFVVRSVAPRSPAEAAGIRPNDVVARINGAEAESIRLKTLRDSLCAEGKALRLAIDREGASRDVTLQLKEWRR